MLVSGDSGINPHLAGKLGQRDSLQTVSAPSLFVEYRARPYWGGVKQWTRKVMPSGFGSGFPLHPLASFMPTWTGAYSTAREVSAVNTSKVIPAAHIERLMEGGQSPRRHLKAALEQPWAALAYA